MRSEIPRFVLFLTLFALLSACGARSGLFDLEDRDEVDAGFDPGRPEAGIDAAVPPVDAAIDAPSPRDTGTDAPFDAGCIPQPEGCGMIEICSNGADDDCNGRVDDGCACEPGEVQPCFAGPPGRRDIGVCSDGAQVCGMSGLWGACEGGISPQPDVCDGQDNLCDGCSAQRDCPIACPSPGDPRVPDTVPFADYALRGVDFYPGMARSWRWSVQGGPCDRLSPALSSFELRDRTRETATFVPRLSGDYTVSLDVVTIEGTRLSCSWLVHVAGPGLRIEMCYPESETQDLDLFVHRPGSLTRWYPRGATAREPNSDSCGWHNCEAELRGPAGTVRADWGYTPSPLSECENGPLGAGWVSLGFCANPRLDIDNNLSPGAIGLPENINIDAPGDGETFRVMIQNWSGDTALPVVNVYCSGRRVATYGQAPDTVPGFRGRPGDETVGAMWRVVDVTTRVSADGSLACELAPVHPPGAMSGYDVTFDNGRY